MWVVSGIFFVGVGVYFLNGYLKKRRRNRIYRVSFPLEWEAVLEKVLPPYRNLEEKDKRHLQGLIHLFLAEKRFEGCGGLEVTDRMRVSIAGAACFLVLKNQSRLYPRLRSVLVYPSAYKVSYEKSLFHRTESEPKHARLGESWGSGTVVLAWDQVVEDAHDWKDGNHVVFHEFAHQLDQEDGMADGAPMMYPKSRYRSWARVLGKEYKKLIRKLEREQKTVLDAYGATNPAEFFAVATETFFEKPHKLARKHPRLFAQLEQFYGMDPRDLTE